MHLETTFQENFYCKSVRWVARNIFQSFLENRYFWPWHLKLRISRKLKSTEWSLSYDKVTYSFIFSTYSYIFSLHFFIFPTSFFMFFTYYSFIFPISFIFTKSRNSRMWGQQGGRGSSRKSWNYPLGPDLKIFLKSPGHFFEWSFPRMWRHQGVEGGGGVLANSDIT